MQPLPPLLAAIAGVTALIGCAGATPGGGESRVPVYTQGKIPASTVARVGTIADRLVRAAGGPRCALLIAESADPRALSSEDGVIVLSTGLLHIAATDSQLAFALAHELSHVQLGHGSAMRGQAFKEGFMPSIRYSWESRNASSAAMRAKYAERHLKPAALSVLGFSREKEMEADREGMQIMARAGFDPRQAANMLRSLMRWQSVHQMKAPPEYLSTHPADGRRLEALRVMAAEAHR